MDLHQKASALLKLHHQPQPVVFVNAWDAASARIVAELGFPAVATTTDVATLTRLGVRRISLGSAPASHLLAAFRRAALEVRDEGTYSFAADRISHAELNALFARR